MARIYFTPEDLVRTRVGQTLGPLAETITAFQTLQRRDGRCLFGGWRQLVRSRLPQRSHLLRNLFPGYDRPFDLDTLVGRTRSMDGGLDQLRSLPRSHLRPEVEFIVGERAVPGWVHTIADRDGSTLAEVADAINEFHGTAFGDRWNNVNAYLEASAARLQRILATKGVEALLTALSPGAHWQAPILDFSMAAPGNTRVLHLGGRGLLVVPSLFRWPQPSVAVSQIDDASPVILYAPMVHSLTQFVAAWDPAQAGPRALQKLLGRTRAAVLDAIADGHATTTHLATRLGISLANASEHATVLRQAGLVMTQRERGAVHHMLTPLGAALLDNQWMDATKRPAGDRRSLKVVP